jgi:hypothetical protein
MYNTTTGQVLGASTAVGGIMSLPYTGEYLPAMLLSYLAIVSGSLVIGTFLITRITKLFLSK